MTSAATPDFHAIPHAIRLPASKYGNSAGRYTYHNRLHADIPNTSAISSSCSSAAFMPCSVLR